jgi:hypothetical protein
MADIVQLNFNSQPVAMCECGCQEFYLLLDGFDDGWKELLGTQCVECGNIVDWAAFTDDD